MNVIMPLSRFWSRIQNQRLQTTIREALTSEARQEAALLPRPEDAALEQIVWQRLEATLPFLDQDQTARARVARPWLVFGPLLVTAAAGAAIFVLESNQNISLETPSSSTPSSEVRTLPYDGIKGGEQVGDTTKITGLRFAVVEENGAIVPGRSDHAVSPASTLVFSLEGTGVTPSGLPVKLEYQKVPFSSPTLVSDYIMRSDREIMRGADGYIAFRPREPGTYVFRARIDSPVEGTDDVSLVIQVR